MKVEPRHLSDWVEPEVTERRFARQWASIERRRPVRGSAGVRVLRLSFVVAPLLCAAVFVMWTQRVAAPATYGVIESTATPLTVQLRDGSSVELATQTRLRVLRDQAATVQLEIGEGRARFDVKHVEGRTFDVRAGVVSVRVVGTNFEVIKATRAEGTQIEVAVKRGIVEVRRGDRGADVRRLSAGETWSAWVAAEPVRAAPRSPAAQPEAVAPAVDERSDAAAVSGSIVLPSASARGPSSVRRVVSIEPRVPPASAHGLFEQASVARRAGRMEEAADVFAELLKRFPRDNRAGVAAFELGRIRMDVLSDAKGAAQAFSEALRASKRASFREDALARLVIAYDTLGEREACRRVRAHYLAQYPAGAHLTAVGLLCGAAQ